MAIERATVAAGEGRIIGEDEIACITGHDHRLNDALAQLGASSVIVVPFVVLGATIAEALFVFTPESGRHHGSEDLTLAQEVARRAAHIIESAQLQERLRQSEARLRVALSRSNIAVFEEDTAFRLRWICNSPFGDDVTGSSMATHMAPSVVAALETTKRRVLETGEGASTGCDFLIRGDRRHFFMRFEPLLGVAGVEGITGAAIDVTELKRVQDELAPFGNHRCAIRRRSNRLYDALAALGIHSEPGRRLWLARQLA